jgi:hypothetical protein
MVTPGLFVAAAVIYILFFFYAYSRMERLRLGTAEWIERRRKKPFTLHRAGTFCKKDILPLSVITAVYAAVAFINLGSTTSPQSFLRFERGENTVAEIELFTSPAFTTAATVRLTAWNFHPTASAGRNNTE